MQSTTCSIELTHQRRVDRFEAAEYTGGEALELN